MQVRAVRFPQPVSTRSRPKAADNEIGKGIKGYSVSTRSRPKAAEHREHTPSTHREFQLAAARRRLISDFF